MPARNSIPSLGSRGAWTLAEARHAAESVTGDPGRARELLRALRSPDPEVRRRAADTTRRVTERDPPLLQPYAEEVLGVLADSAEDDWRTVSHLGLVGARLAGTRAERLRAAGLLRPLLGHRSGVVRCTALEGLGLLASRVPELRAEVELLLEEAICRGTAAMRSRARTALAWLK